MSTPTTHTPAPSGDIRMEIFKTLMTSKDPGAYSRLISLLYTRPTASFSAEAQTRILAAYEQEQWTEVLRLFEDPVCLLCPGTLLRVGGALEKLGLTEMAFQVSSLCKRLVMLIEQSGNGTELHPFSVANPTAAEFFVRDVRKAGDGKAQIHQRLTVYVASVPTGVSTQLWFDVTTFALASSGQAVEAAIPATRPSSSPTLPIAPSSEGPASTAFRPSSVLNPTVTPPPFKPTETRFGARTGSRPTLTNITPQAPKAPPKEIERLPDPLPCDTLIQSIKQKLGEPDSILKGLEHSGIPVELYHFKPARRREFHTLITVGMSALPMTVPEGSEAYRYAELILHLPPDWTVNKNSLMDEKFGWPMVWQMKMARYVHEARMWFHHLHNFNVPTVGQTLHPSTQFTGWLLVRPESLGMLLERIQLPDGRTIHFYAMTAIYFEENEFKMREVRGGEELWERIRAASFTDVLFPSRRNVIASKPESKTLNVRHP